MLSLTLLLVFFQSCLALQEERELVCVLLVLLFVYFAFVKFCPFSLSNGDRGWLQLVLVALP